MLFAEVFAMRHFIECENRSQITLFPERLEDYVAEDNPVRVVDAFVDQLDLFGLGFRRFHPRVRCGPATILRLCLNLIFAVISTVSNQAVVLNGKRRVMWK